MPSGSHRVLLSRSYCLFFEVMRFIGTCYKVLIEFHRSSPGVTQNGEKKSSKLVSVESMIKNTKWEREVQARNNSET